MTKGLGDIPCYEVTEDEALRVDPTVEAVLEKYHRRLCSTGTLCGI